MARPAPIRALRATRVLFLLEGYALGCWGAHVPSVQRHLALDEGRLSLALLAGALGALLSLGLAPRATARWGPRRVVAVGGVVMALSLAGLMLPSSLPGLLVLVLLLGLGATLADVAMNAEGALLETHTGRKLMSGLHGCFSLGGMLGAGSTALLLSLDWPAQQQLPLQGALVGLGLLPAARALLPLRSHDAAPQPGWRLPHGRLALLGTLAALGMLAEGAMYDWSALYLQTAKGAAPVFGALAFASFSAAMALGRFGGDALRERLAPPQLLAAGALLAASGLVLALGASAPGLALVGLALVGLGLANGVPLLFLAATQVPGVSAAGGIAGVAALGFMGFLLGPPLIGLVAQHSSLGTGLGLVLLCLLLLGAGARRL